MAYNKRKKSMKANQQLRRVLHQIQEREQKRFNDARILREEAMKVKAARLLRFGRFAVKVPSVNVTRFYDYPLPESEARPADVTDNEITKEEVSKYVPGQKDYGVMIPELTKPNNAGNKEKRDRESKLKKLKSFHKKKRQRDRREYDYLSTIRENKSDSTHLNDGLDIEKSHSIYLTLKPKETFEFNSKSQKVIAEGFELISTHNRYKKGILESLENNKSCSLPKKSLYEERQEGYHCKLDAQDEPHSSRIDFREVEIQNMVSDLTFEHDS